MSKYDQAGVNIELGDKCSSIAYSKAKATFAGRKNMIGQPLLDDGGFTGALDMGDYYLVQNDDGVGTKLMIAEAMEKYDTMGYDLLCMVVDDAVCVGAEPISVSNTIDVDKIDEKKITALMDSLKNAALKHKVVVPGGEIAELGPLCNGYIWNATCVGIVEKHKLITTENVKTGDKIIGLRSEGFRSNGFTLIRYILKEKFGEKWFFEKFDDEKSWGEAVLTPSKIYCSAIMDMHGRYKQKSKVELKGVAHITGGGITGNLPRILKKTGLGAVLDNLPEPHEMMKRLIEMGNIPLDEAYETWNMGVGMILISNDFDAIKEICDSHGIDCQVIGKVTDTGGVEII